MRERIERHAAKHVGRVVALTEGRRRMSVFMSHHGKDEHGKGEHEVAELSIQVSVLGVGGRKVTWSSEASQNAFPLDLACRAAYVFARHHSEPLRMPPSTD